MRTETSTRGALRELGERGRLAACLREGDPRSPDDLPLDFGRFAALVAEVVRRGDFGLASTLCLHLGVFVPMLVRLAPPGLAGELVPAALRGDLVGTIASTESAESGGSDFMAIETAATFAEDRITLRGRKDYVTNAAAADHAVVFARWRPGRHFGSFCAVLVPLGLPGVRRSETPMAVLPGAGVGRIELDGVTVDAGHLLGRRPFGFQYFARHIAVERLAGGVWAVAVAEGCLAEAREHARGRRVGEDVLWGRGAVRQRFAEAVTEVVRLRALTERIVARADRTGVVDQAESAALKAAIPAAMERVVGFCLQLRGASGLEAGSGLLRLLDDFRAFGVAGGPTETMLDLLADLWAPEP